MHVATVPAFDQLTDHGLAGRIVSGDRAALTYLMRRHNQSLFRVARSVLKDDTEAEEAVQDAYVRAFYAMKDFRGDAKLSTWLTRIVLNEALGRLRKRRRRAEVIRLNSDLGFDADEHPSQDTAYAPPQEGLINPERAVFSAQLRVLIEHKIDLLPDAFRSVFMLRALEELNVAETAECLDIPEATVRSRYFRARGLLRESLAREIDGCFDSAFSFAGARCDRIVNTVLERIAAAPRGPNTPF